MPAFAGFFWFWGMPLANREDRNGPEIPRLSLCPNQSTVVESLIFATFVDAFFLFGLP
jgi:hypothetical protein